VPLDRRRKTDSSFQIGVSRGLPTGLAAG